jgi:hypothetical protein
MNNSDNIVPFHVIKTKLRRVKKQSGYGTLKATHSLYFSLSMILYQEKIQINP